jgi:hypothetical protein
MKAYDVDAFAKPLPPVSMDPLDVDAFGEPLSVDEAGRRFEAWASCAPPVSQCRFRPVIPLWPAVKRRTRTRTRATLEFGAGLLFMALCSLFVAFVLDGWLS